MIVERLDFVRNARKRLMRNILYVTRARTRIIALTAGNLAIKNIKDASLAIKPIGKIKAKTILSL
jgi:hypothetical protein